LTGRSREFADARNRCDSPDDTSPPRVFVVVIASVLDVLLRRAEQTRTPFCRRYVVAVPFTARITIRPKHGIAVPSPMTTAENGPRTVHDSRNE
jgi:hypothetical protein